MQSSKQANSRENHENENFRNIGQGEGKQRSKNGLNLTVGNQSYGRFKVTDL